MPDPHQSQFLDDPEFQSLLVGCLESLQRGETIDREALAKDYPKFASEIGQFLDDRHLLEQVAAEFGDVDPSKAAISAHAKTIPTDPGSAGFGVGERIRYIGEYEVLEGIARGGMGVVFKARQQELKRIVALKMILAGRLADDSDVERFRREARAAARLKHTNIVPVHEVGEHDGRHYFTMDFVDGPNLAETIRDETLAPRAAAELVRTAAEAVQYAHEQGTVHRDLKPSNVILDATGQPHITDFGLAKLMEAVDDDSRAELTSSGQVLGTPSYMSPEQASGTQEVVGPASDIYSLGAILYACLTGRAPFVADSPVDTLLQVMRKDAVSPRELNPSVPKDLETICLKCLVKEPHKRYGTAQELADDLSRFLEGRPVVARPIGPISKTVRWCRRNIAVACLLSLLFLSMAIGTYVSFNYAVEAVRHAQDADRQRAHAEAARVEAENQRRQAERARVEAERERDSAATARAEAERALKQEELARREADRARQAEADARRAAQDALVKEKTARSEAEQRRIEALWQTYVAQLQPMAYRLEQREYGQLESMLQQAGPQSDDDPDFRGWEWHYLHGLCRQQTSRFADGAEFAKFFDWHPKTKRLATFRKNDLELWAGDPLDFQKRITAHPPGHVRFSPDGTQLAVADKFTLKVFAVAAGNVTATIDLAEHQDTNRNSKYIQSLEWRPDGSALATGTNMGAIHLWSPESGELIKSIESLPHNFPCNNMHWHPTNPILAVGTRFGRVSAIDIDEDKPVWVNRIDRDYVFAVRWNPSGTKLAGATNGTSDGARLVIWNRDGEQTMRSADKAITGTPAIDWLNDEELVVATSDHDIHHFRTDGELPIKTLRVHDGPVERVLHYGDGQRVFSASTHNIRVTRVSDTVQFATAVPVHKFGIKAISWSPDSQRVATVSWDGVVAITNVRTGEVIHQLEGHRNGGINDVAWSRDGLRIASCDHSDEFCIWDPDAGELLMRFDGVRGRGEFNSLAWIDSDRIVGGQRKAAIYDVNSGETLFTLAERPYNYARFAYNAKRQLIGHLGNGRLAVFNTEGQKLYETKLHSNKGLAWSPDGKLLASGGESGIDVIDCVNFEFLTTIHGHAGTVTDVCFSPDGSRIASSGRDGTVRVWDRATGAELLILEHRKARSFGCVGWSPDGSTIVAGAKGLIVAWSTFLPADSCVPSSLPTGVIASVRTRAEEIAELAKAIEQAPTDVASLRKRADLYAAQMMWSEALADYQRVLDIKPTFSWEAVSAARAALMMGDGEEYQRRIAVQVEKFLERNPPGNTVTGDYVASTAALAPRADFDLPKLLSLSLAHYEAKDRAAWASRGVILLQLRLGNAAEVVKLVEKYKSKPSPNYPIFLQAAEALAQHQLGDPHAAMQAVNAALSLAEKAWYTPLEGEPITYSDLGIYVEAKALLDEAKAEILGTAASHADETAGGQSREEETGAVERTKHIPRDPLEGEWTIRQAIANGTERSDVGSGKATFAGGRFVSDLGFEEITYELDPSRTPAAIDFLHTHDGEMVRALGIYQLQGDTLMLVMHQPPVSARPKRFSKNSAPEVKGKHAGRLFLVLERRRAASSQEKRRESRAVDVEMESSSNDEYSRQIQ